jgi:hypothetical protein
MRIYLMEPKPANELLLTTLADRDSRIRTARLKLGRLIALFAGIATILLLASHHPAKASGTSSLLPDGAGLSISIPLGDFPGTAGRPTVQILALVAGDEQVGPERDRPASPRRIAFTPIATVGGLAGVAAWPSTRLSPVNRSRDGARTPTPPARRASTGPTTRTALARPPIRQSGAGATQADSIEPRRKARLATTFYQRMLRRYLSLSQDTSRATVICPCSPGPRALCRPGVAQICRNEIASGSAQDGRVML